MDQIPGKASAKIFQKKWFVEFFTVIPPIIAAGVAVWINYSDTTKGPIVPVLIIAAVWLIVASGLRVFNAHQQDSKEDDQKSYEGLRGAMHVLYSMVSKHLHYDDGDSGRLRITMHRVLSENGKGDPTGLEQMLPYIGGKGGGAGRNFSINPGIIGLVARSGEVRVASHVGDHATFVKELVSNWSYTEAEAKSLTSDRETWMAVPIFGANRKVLAVIFLDSADKTAFDKSAIELVLNGCVGIASYISQHYSVQVKAAELPSQSSKSQIEKVVEVSAEGASLNEKHVVLTGEGALELTSTAASLEGASPPPAGN